MAKSPQEQLWEGDFGNAYTDRNQVDPAARAPFFAKILKLTGSLSSACEFGAGRGHNLAAIASLGQDLALSGVEPNERAWTALSALPGVRAIRASIQSLDPAETFDLVFCCGVLIHVNPDDLSTAYDRIFASSARYVLLNEYFNPTPVEIPYRDNREALFKRDFGGEFLDRFPGRLRVVDYGFLWKRLEPTWDDTTWWLFEKVEA